MKKWLNFMALMALILSVVACSSDKKPADEAIKASEAAINAAKGEAVKFVPDQVKALEDGLKAAQDAFAKKEYKAALDAAKDLPAKAKDLTAAAAAKKDELTKAWEEINGALPKMVEAIKDKVETLAKSKKLPANVDKEKFEGIKTGLPELTQAWDDAQKAFSGGSVADAVSKAKTVKDKAAEMMTTLGIQAPEAPKS